MFIIIPDEQVNNNLSIKGNEKKNILYTRYPVNSRVIIKYEERILFEKNLLIHQYGRIVPVYCPLICK